MMETYAACVQCASRVLLTVAWDDDTQTRNRKIVFCLACKYDNLRLYFFLESCRADIYITWEQGKSTQYPVLPDLYQSSCCTDKKGSSCKHELPYPPLVVSTRYEHENNDIKVKRVSLHLDAPPPPPPNVIIGIIESFPPITHAAIPACQVPIELHRLEIPGGAGWGPVSRTLPSHAPLRLTQYAHCRMTIYSTGRTYVLKHDRIKCYEVSLCTWPAGYFRGFCNRLLVISHSPVTYIPCPGAPAPGLYSRAKPWHTGPLSRASSKYTYRTHTASTVAWRENLCAVLSRAGDSANPKRKPRRDHAATEPSFKHCCSYSNYGEYQ